MNQNFDVELEQIKKELLNRSKSAKIDIQSDKKNFTGKPLGGRTKRNGLDTDPNSPVLDCFQLNGRNFYLVLKG
ncbi:MAG: hypothetical protein A2X64_00005 [Ignavibacteria bacterium GWF2_33_9]|nr:MAG: hypothetical protein A2X64_00005 [Ignavibacteria bacterium GWF2_33_9]